MRPIPSRRALLLALALGSAAWAEGQDVFDFIPPGGRSLLEGLRAAGLPEAAEAAMTSESGDAGHWQALLDGAEAPAVAALEPWERDTLAQYLAVRAPLAAGEELPRDGRDMVLALCQSCHIVTVVITQERTREAWLGTMNSPSHIEIETTPEERGLIADYLVLNAGIPIDLVPPELRAGGASY